MNNPFSNPHTSSRMNRVFAATRDALLRMNSAGAGAKSARGWVIALVVCALLVGGISLTSIANKQQSKSAGTLTALTAPETKAAATPAKLQEKSSAKPTAKPSQKKPLASVKSAQVKHDSNAERVSEKRLEAGIHLRPEVQLSPDGLEAKAGEGQQESGEEIRARGSWFFDQRAYPNKHIPADAYQKAIQQRDSMRQQQRAAFKPAAGAQAIISFPGDALWHLMGPQPINTPFGQNSGGPIASGRITAIAVDPADATANTVYVGGAAGGVWKTTDGGTTWNSLTDGQPSLAVGSIAIDPNNHLTIYVGTGEDNFNGDAFYGAGILKSIDGGNTWTQLGASIFAGAKSTGVGGAKIGAIAVQPGNSSIVLASVFFFDGNDANGGVWRSTDGGTTWARPTTGAQGSAGTAVFFESTPNAGTTAIAWAALGDIFAPNPASNGIWRSTDSGANWTKQTGGLPTTNLGRITLGYAPSTSGIGATVYAAIANATPVSASSDLQGLFKTVNGGTTWTSITTLTFPSFPTFTGGFCAHQCFYDMAIGVHPTNPNVVVVGGGAGPDNLTSLFQSPDGGTTWTGESADSFTNGTATIHPHVDTHAIVFSPSGTLKLYVGNDGGMWSTTNPVPGPGVSPTWVDLNAQLSITQFYPGITAAVSDENYGFGGTQDNDVELFQNSLTWQNEFICGDGGFTAIDQTTPTTIYATCDSGAGSKVKKAVMNGQYLTFANTQQFPGFDVAEKAITASGDHMQFIPPIALDDKNPENLYFGTCRVWQTTNAASSLANSFIPLTPTWAPISNDLSNGAVVTTSCPAPGGAGNITNLEVAHSNSSVIVAGTSNGKVWETTVGGAGNSWTEIDASALPARHVTAVRTKRSDSTGNIVYVTFSGFGACGGCGATPGHVFKTTNAAGGTPTWTNISGDLPDIPVNDIVVDHDSNPTHDALYIATDVGVFACPDPEAATPCTNWTVIGDGLPNSPVLSLALRQHSRILRAGTHGRSMWQIQLSNENPPPFAALSSITPAAISIPPSAGTTAVTVTGVNFSTNTQVVTIAGVMGITTTFVNTTQLNVTIPNSLLQTAGVFNVLLTDPAGVDPGSTISSQGIGGLLFTVMNPLLDPLTMTPATAQAFTAVPLHLTSATAAEPFVPGTVLAFYDLSTPPVLQFQLPTAFDAAASITSGGTVYDLTTAITDFTTPATYQVVPYNATPGGGIDDLSLNIPTIGLTGPVPFTFTVTANPGPVIQVSSPLSLVVNALGANTGTTYTFFQVTNLVGATLSITNATITGTNAANFVFIAPIAPPSCNFDTTHTVSVTGGSSCFFGLKYTALTPPGNAQSVATLNITDNAPGLTQSFPITGNITPTAGLVFLTPVNFGNVGVGTTSPTMNATLSNFSGSSINVTSTFSVSGANLGDFHIVPFVSSGDGNSACPSVVPFVMPTSPAVGSACDVTLTFTPSLPASAESANLNVTASVPVTTVSPNLTGTGIKITSISPSIVATGGPAFTLTVNGGGFAPSAVVNVSSINGTNVIPRLTTFVSANQLLASIPASDITAPGSLAITVTTPVPGGTTSEPKTLIVAQATPATNDNILFATNAGTTPFRITQDTTQATTQLAAITTPPAQAIPADPLPPCASGSKARSIWFQFKAPANGKVIADSRFSTYTTILSAWTLSGALPSSTVTFSAAASGCASGNVSGTTPESLIGFAVTSGTTYYVMVTDSSASGLGGTLTFRLDFQSTAPANDDNATPTVIAPTSLPYSNTVNSIQATANTNGHTDPTPPCAAGAAGTGQDNSVWWSFTPTSSGTIVADTLTSPYETILNVTSVTANGTQVMCNVSAAAGIAQSQVSFAATSGTTYFFMVSSFLGDGGSTNFHLTFSASASNPVPTITSFAPASATAGGTAFALTINGTNFVSGATGTFNGAARTVTFVSATQVTMAVTAADIAAAGSFPVVVSNPAPGGGPSAPMNFMVNNPVPTTTSISPTSATAGGAGFTLTVNGTNFNASSVVNFNGAAKATTFVSASQITAAILATDIATAGSVNVSVTNPGPGGGTSGAQSFTINNPAPTITSLSPTGATAGGAAFTLTVNGTGFVATSSVKFNGTARVTTFVSATQVTAAILASDIASVGTPPVTVTNPAPGGGTSAAVNFNVSAANNPVPTLTSISPTTAVAGSAAFTLTLTGTNFIAGSTVNFGANPPLVPTTQTATQLQVTVPAADILTGGNVNVTVTNPAPGGGTTSAQSFTITNPAATITSFSPASATAGGAAFTLTINGSNFVSGATGTFNGTARTVAFVSSTQVTMAVTAPDIAAAGAFPVVVSNPAPGGGSTGAVLYTVNNVVPTLTSISPTSATAGGAAFTLTLNGTGFVSGSTAKFGVVAPAATFVSSTQLTAAITAPDIVTAGVVNVSVTNPAPGGGTTATQAFSINNPVPSITSLAPASATAGSAAFTLTINGANFINGATGTFNGITRTVTFVSAAQVTMAVTAPDIAAGGTFPVVVSNPGPGGGASAPSNFTVNNLVPTITSLSPTSATAGGTAFALTINGTNFVSTTTGTFNGTARTITFVSATQVTMAVTAADIAAAGAFPVVVSNPAPGGGASTATNFTVNNPAPTITSLSPTSATAGGAAFTLTVNGTGFVAGSAVKFNGNAKTTTFVSATQVTAAITAADIATAGSFPVAVTNAAPGGGTSAATNFTVNNPVPTITSFVPASATAGSAAFTLTINGTNFVSGATGTFNGTARTVTFVNATQVTMAVTAPDIATAGTFPVVLSNPAPGGGASAPSNYTVNNPAPTISSLSPTGATAGGAAFTLTVNGTGFVSASSVKFNGTARTTTFVSATQITAAILATDIASAGSFPVTVTNPAPGGGISTAVNFNVSVANNPVPTLTSISPTSATAGGAAFTLTATGTNFVFTSVVNFNGAAKTTTFVSATQVTAAITAADIAAAGVVNVTVTNPAPGGGTTSAQSFTINNPAPTVTTLSPTSATAGGAAFTLTVNGTGLVSSSQVKFNGNAKTTTFVSATQVTAAITAADIATAGSFPVTVTNAAPGGGTSAAVNFAVNNPAPTITTLSPVSATAGSAAFTLTVNGTNFVATSVVNYNGTARATTFLSATQITAAIAAADIATAGSFPVTVTNPAPGGGTSAAVNFAVNNPLPTITSLSPNTLVAGGAAFTLTVNGTNFTSTSQVKFNGTARTTTFVSATQITAAILASDIATSGNANVTVTNPAPGGGTTTNFVFVITSAPNPVPTLTSISPTSATAGGAAFTLTVNGTNYVASSVVNFNGSARTTTVVSATQLTAGITAADIATAGSFPITVFNPAPGGGTSSAINLAVNNPVPTITTLSPAGATVGGAAFALTVNGTGFVNGATVNFNGAARTTTFVSATQVTAAITAGDIASVGSVPVTVTNPAPGGGTSSAVNFSVTNPAPAITTLSPTSTIAGGAAFVLTISGSNFAAGATVNFGANPALTPTTITAGQIIVTVPTGDIASAGSVNVTVTNPAPGGGTSAAAVFTINNPAPTLASISPTSGVLGQAVNMTLTGSNFVAGAIVNFGANADAGGVVSNGGTTLTITIPTAQVNTAGPVNVTVTNAAPGGGTTSAQTFTVNNPVPTLTSIAPTSGLLGQSVNLVLTGTNLIAGSIVNFGANADLGGVVSNGGNTLTITIPAAQLNAAGPVNVTVKNPAPGGGTTAAQTFTVNNPGPTLTAVAPTSGVLGQAANLTLTGTNFIAGSIVNFGANADAGGVVSNGGNTLTITIPATQLNAAGAVNITVKNPAPGGGTTAAVVFTVNNPQPVLTSLSPANANAGGGGFTLTVNGSLFLNGAVVSFNGAAKTTTFVSATQVTAAINAADIATGGTFNVLVTNPAPTVGPSAALQFNVNNPVPTVTSAKVNGATHASGGVALNMTIAGTNFVTGSTANFGTNPAITPTAVTPTQITVTIPASDVSSAGNVNVTVTNPAPPANNTSAASVFTVDGFTVSGPANTPVQAGKPANIVITVTATNPAGFANPISFAVTGLPAHSTATFSPANIPSFTTSATTTTLTIMTTARGAAPPSAPVDTPTSPLLRLLPVLWLAAMLVGLAAVRMARRSPQRRRYATVLSLAMLLLTGAVLAGCAGGKTGTPAGPAQLTITATSGTMAVPTPANSVTLTVQ
jgi:hypothetical protein